jgi:hypothetical protein
MSETGPLANERSLAQLESDLLGAEATFADADHRLKQAERDRNAALDTINQLQWAFDEAIESLRQRGTPGSKWQLSMENGQGPSMLRTDGIYQVGDQSGVGVQSEGHEFRGLSKAQRARGNGPIMTISI